MPDDAYFASHFNTPLSPQEEAAFLAWARLESLKAGRDVLMDVQDYDLRGLWKSGGGFGPDAHATDQFKKPNHPAFSNESQYNGAVGPDGRIFVGGHWEGNTLVPPFTPVAGGAAMPGPYVNPQGGTLLPGVDQGWTTDPSSMLMDPTAGGMGQLLPGMPGGAAPAAGGMDPRAIQMMLFQKLNNRPAQGPFSAIANPIVAALTARAMAPMYQQQQQQALELQRMKVLQALAGVQASQASAGLNTAKTGELVAQSNWFKSLPEEKQQEYFALKGGMAVKPDTAARIASQENIAGQRIGSAEKIAGAQIGSREEEGKRGRDLRRDLAEYSRETQTGLQTTRLSQQAQQWQDEYNADLEKEHNRQQEEDRKMASMNLHRKAMEGQGERRLGLQERGSEALIAQRKAGTALAKTRQQILTEMQDPNSPTAQLKNAFGVFRGLPTKDRFRFAKANLAPLYKQATGLDLQLDNEVTLGRQIADLFNLPDPLFGEEKVMQIPPRGGAQAPGQQPETATEFKPVPGGLQALSDEELSRIPPDQLGNFPPEVQNRVRKFKLKKKFTLGQ